MTKNEILKKIEKVKEKINEYEVFPDEVEDEFDRVLDKKEEGLFHQMKMFDIERYQKELEVFAENLDKTETIGYNDLLDELDDLEFELEEKE